MTAPNPRVGALALKQGHIMGRGHHGVFGGPHAEEAALRDAGAWDKANDRALPDLVDEMVVTLEPCSATGKKRAPCTQALIDAGVQRVLLGATDPDPRHQGAGVRVLEEAGIAVRQPAADEAAARMATLNRAFLRALAHAERPWIILKWAASLDGKVATDAGVSQWITGPAARAEVHRLRSCSDAVLAGAGTLLEDDPRLDARPEDDPALDALLASRGQPRRVLVGGGDRVAATARIFESATARLWVLGEEAPAAAVDEHGDALVRVARTPNGLDLVEALTKLCEEHGIRRLFVEGGARIHGALLAQGLADAVVRYEAPILLGGQRGACAGPSFETPAAAPRWMDEERADLGGDLRRAFLIEDAMPCEEAGS